MSWKVHLTGKKQLVTNEDRLVPLPSKLRWEKQEVFIWWRLDNFLSAINNIPLTQPLLLQQMTAVKTQDKEASATCIVPFKSNVLYTETCTYQSFMETLDIFKVSFFSESWFSSRIWKRECLEDLVKNGVAFLSLNFKIS